MKLSLVFRILLSLPKSLFFNFRVFPFKEAMKLPVLVSYDVKLSGIKKNCVLIDTLIQPFMIKFNIYEGTESVDVNKSKRGFLKSKENGKIIFKGKANFSCGISIVNGGNLIFGDNFSCNKSCFISCDKKIIFGDNCLLGWDVCLRDSDGHSIYTESVEVKDKNLSIVIGNNVWFGANVKVLKGVSVANNCVIGYNSCLTKSFCKDKCLIGGYPARVLREHISWKK